MSHEHRFHNGLCSNTSCGVSSGDVILALIAENERLLSEVTGLKAEIAVLEAERVDQTPKLPTWQKPWYNVGIDTGRLC